MILGPGSCACSASAVNNSGSESTKPIQTVDYFAAKEADSQWMRDEIEAHSVEHTFKPFEAYELVKILGLMSSRPVLVHDFPSAELGLKLRIHDALSERNKY